MTTLTKRKIILDCDPGIDDAMAILLAVCSPHIDLLGITTVAGNVDVNKTTMNALNLCEFAGITHIPVARGAERPLIRESVAADYVHGESGIGGVVFPHPEKKADSLHAVDFIIQTLMQSDGDITLVAIGPLTNIALAMRKQPGIITKVKEIVIMGGGTFGNITPAAEFNFYVDAEAAKIVFESGAPLTMVGLDLTSQAIATEEVKEDIADVNNDFSRFVIELLTYYEKYNIELGLAGATVHDPCCIVYCIDPTIFTTKNAHVAIETKGEFSYGMSVVDMNSTRGKIPNTNVAYGLDATRFWAMFTDLLGKEPARNRSPYLG